MQRLYRWALAGWLLVIYSTLGVVRGIVDALRASGFLVIAVSGMFAAAFVAGGLHVSRRPAHRLRTLAILTITALVYAAILASIHSPEERAHLFEYGVVALLAYGAFGRYPAALLFTVAAGWLDEGIQALLPTRHYDLRDVGFNALAGALACAALYSVQRSSAASSAAASITSR
jgi:hypothetical protein